jgi:cell division protein FtsQ
VDREFPATLVLRIEERPVAMRVEVIPDSATAVIKHWLLSDDGYWLGSLEDAEGKAQAVNASDVSDKPLLKDISRAVRPVSGAKTDDEGILNALGILAGFSEEMRGLVQSLSAPDKTRTTLTLVNNVGVAFGAAEDIAAKEQAIKTLLNAHPGTITYINVRIPERATYRAVE